MGKKALLIYFIETYGVGEIEGCPEVGDLFGLKGEDKGGKGEKSGKSEKGK